MPLLAYHTTLVALILQLVATNLQTDNWVTSSFVLVLIQVLCWLDIPRSNAEKPNLSIFTANTTYCTICKVLGKAYTIFAFGFQ
jgi:hypothetical protein